MLNQRSALSRNCVFSSIVLNFDRYLSSMPLGRRTYRTVMVLTSLEFHHLVVRTKPPSLRESCDWTEVSLSSLPVIAVAAVPCGVRSDQLARPREQTTERTYPVCWYSIVKEHGSISKALRSFLLTRTIRASKSLPTITSLRSDFLHLF